MKLKNRKRRLGDDVPFTSGFFSPGSGNSATDVALLLSSPTAPGVSCGAGQMAPPNSSTCLGGGVINGGSFVMNGQTTSQNYSTGFTGMISGTHQLPPLGLGDAFDKPCREFEDIFDIDIGTLPPSFFADTLGSLAGASHIAGFNTPGGFGTLDFSEPGGQGTMTSHTFASFVNADDAYFDNGASLRVKRCFSAPSSPLSGLLADFDSDQESSMMGNLIPGRIAVNKEAVPPMLANLTDNDVMAVLEGAAAVLTQQQQPERDLARSPVPSLIVPASVLQTPVSLRGFLGEDNAVSMNIPTSFNAAEQTVQQNEKQLLPSRDLVRSRIAALSARRLCEKAAAPVDPQEEDEEPPVIRVNVLRDRLEADAKPLSVLLANQSRNTILQAKKGIRSARYCDSSPPHQCPVPGCHETFDRPPRVQRHLIWHVYGRGAGPHKCDVPNCSAASTFSNPGLLWSHIQKSHTEVLSPFSLPVKGFAKHFCPVCEARFVHLFELAVHLAAAHLANSQVASQNNYCKTKSQPPPVLPAELAGSTLLNQLASTNKVKLAQVLTSNDGIAAIPKLPTDSRHSLLTCCLCGHYCSNLSGLLLHRRVHLVSMANGSPLDQRPNSSGTILMKVPRRHYASRSGRNFRSTNVNATRVSQMDTRSMAEAPSPSNVSVGSAPPLTVAVITADFDDQEAVLPIPSTTHIQLVMPSASNSEEGELVPVSYILEV